MFEDLFIDLEVTFARKLLLLKLLFLSFYLSVVKSPHLSHLSGTHFGHALLSVNIFALLEKISSCVLLFFLN